MLLSSRGPLILEVNSSPGLEGIEGSTGTNIARKVAEYLTLEYQNNLEEVDLNYNSDFLNISEDAFSTSFEHP